MISVCPLLGSKTGRSSRKGCRLRLTRLTAEACLETNSAAVTPPGSLPAAGFGSATGRIAPNKRAQLRSNAASRRSATEAGRSSPLNLTAPLCSRAVELDSQPAG